jgi:hypothetical protein
LTLTRAPGSVFCICRYFAKNRQKSGLLPFQNILDAVYWRADFSRKSFRKGRNPFQLHALVQPVAVDYPSAMDVFFRGWLALFKNLEVFCSSLRGSL